VRVAYQALSAVLGGTQSLHTNGFDEALSLPTENAARLALRTQQLLAAETGVSDTVDPLAGSYFVENLTNELEAHADEYMARIAGQGGAASAIEFMRDEIHQTAYARQRAIEAGEVEVVGVNAYRDDEPSVVPRMPDFGALAEEQRRRLDELKTSRDADAVAAALHVVRDTARGQDNMLPPLIAAIRVRATLGEISHALRDEWGVYRPGS
jgi:methylmalonyl-CoA mutase N-terminal domain/subunit